ncbi:hypothetical protein D0Y65_014367 [Glycine soja]|uniref:Uncharacterized protein n=1 Tax=Glycine soja TaxID=3848 RepID=A0A445K7X5_GLYSO|nr:hypothetical protein D0Y65_014367 [Glycine soja]
MERMSQKIDGDAESECVSEAGDIGDRTLLGTRHSEGDGLRLSLDSTPKNEDVYISRDHELQLASCRFFDHLWGRDSQGFQMVSQLAKHEAWKRHFYLRSTGRWFLAPNCQCFRCLGCGWTCHCKEIRTNLGIQSFFKYVLLYTLLRQIDPWLRNGMKFGQSTMTWRGQARRVVQQWRNSLVE